MDMGSSIHTIGGFGDSSLTFCQALEGLAKSGCHHLMLIANEDGPTDKDCSLKPGVFPNVRGSDPGAFMRMVSSYGLRISSLFPAGAVDVTPEGKSAMIENWKQYRDVAWSIGCHTLTVCAGWTDEPRTPFAKKQEKLALFAEILNAVADETPGKICKIAVDIHYRGVLETVADAEFLYSLTRPNAGLCLNIGHMTTLGEKGWQLLEKYPERIHVMAWKDHLHGDNLPKAVFSTELGRGATPFDEYIRAYRAVESRFNGSHIVTFEDVPVEDKQPALARSLDFLTKKFAL